MIDSFFYRGRKKALLTAIDLAGYFIKRISGVKYNYPLDPGIVKRILFINPAHLGDNLLSTPLLAGLKKHFADASITYLTKQWSADAVKNHPAIGILMEYNPPWACNPGQRPHSYRELLRIAGHLRKEKFDLAVVTQFDPRNIIFARLCGVNYCAGISNNGLGFLLTHKVDIKRYDRHMVEYNLDLLRVLGAEPGDARLDFFIPEKEEEKAGEKWELQTAGGRKSLLIHPGAGHEAKRWDADKYADLCRRAAAGGFRVLMTGGPGDGPVTDEIEKKSQGAAVNLSGRLSLNEMAYFLKKADAVVVQDSGLLHLAAAEGANIIALYGPTDERNWGPYKTGRVIKGKCPQYPCPSYKRCKYSSKWSCMKEIPVEAVYAAVIETTDRR